MQANTIDLTTAKRLACWSGYNVTPITGSGLTGLEVRRNGRVVAKYYGRGYTVIEEHDGPTVYSLLPTLNVMRWED